MSKKSDLARQKIIAAFYQLISEKGYKKASIRELGEICHMSKGHINFYFNKKEDIAITIVEGLYERSDAIINELDHQMPKDPLLKILLSHLFIDYLVHSRQATYNVAASVADDASLMDWYSKRACEHDYEVFSKLGDPIDKEDLIDIFTFAIHGAFAYIRRCYLRGLPFDYRKGFKLTLAPILIQLDFPEAADYIQKTLDLFDTLDKAKLLGQFQDPSSLKPIKV